MLDLLPPHIVEHLHDRYAAGVADAEALFAQHSADEDSITGGLGQSIASRDPVVFVIEGQRFEVAISYRKVRGRGPGAPEKKFGADGIFQIQVNGPDGRVARRKGLPFQAKKDWRKRDKKLLSQVSTMEQFAPGGIVIDYTGAGYKACSADVVIAAGGSRNELEKLGAMRPLGQLLSRDFLECRVGRVGLFFDTEIEEFSLQPQTSDDLHLVTTLVSQTD
jgi:hypothetical protein